eukprot:23060-Eustigmatos_ZCMA.PRE.1
MVRRPCASKPLWFVTRPTRVPTSGAKPLTSNTSIPDRTEPSAMGKRRPALITASAMVGARAAICSPESGGA